MERQREDKVDKVYETSSPRAPRSHTVTLLVWFTLAGLVILATIAIFFFVREYTSLTQAADHPYGDRRTLDRRKFGEQRAPLTVAACVDGAALRDARTGAVIAIFRQLHETLSFSRPSPINPTEFWRKTRRERAAAPLPYRIQMARIRRTLYGGTTRVKVTGRLLATDMGRLEHACAPALIDRAIALEIDLRRVTDVDLTAQAVLRRMSGRGARIQYPPGLAIVTSLADSGPATTGRDNA